MQGPNRNNFVTIADLVLIIGVIALLVPLIWTLRTGFLQSRERAEWTNSASQSRTSARNERIRLVIPRIGVDAIVVDEVTEADLDRGPMRLAGSPLPGRPGNCSIAGHKEKWFRRLGNLAPGDKVKAYTGGKCYVYVVTGSSVVGANDTSVLADTKNATITLITCTGRPYFGSGGGRLVVSAELRECLQQHSSLQWFWWKGKGARNVELRLEKLEQSSQGPRHAIRLGIAGNTVDRRAAIGESRRDR